MNIISDSFMGFTLKIHKNVSKEYSETDLAFGFSLFTYRRTGLSFREAFTT